MLFDEAVDNERLEDVPENRRDQMRMMLVRESALLEVPIATTRSPKTCICGSSPAPRAEMAKNVPVPKAPDVHLKKKNIDALEAAPGAEVQRWARGEATLQELKGYSAEELYFIAQQGYTLFLNGKIEDAQTVFEGLVAVDPRNDYYYRALGVVCHRRGDAEKAIRHFTNALKVDSRSVRPT